MSGSLTTQSSAARKPFILVTGDYVRTGGQDAANFAVADYLARAGRDVHLVGYRFDETLAARANVKLHRVPKLANSYTLSGPFLSAAALFRYRALRNSNACLLANGGNCPAPSANWVHYVHAAYRSRSPLPLQRVRQALTHRLNLANERLALHSARVILANSERTRRDVIELLRVPAERVETVYYGVDPERFHVATEEKRREAAASLGWPLDRFRVAFVGALADRRKGFDLLFDAWIKLAALPTWDGQLVVVGTGAELDLWRRRAKEKKVDEMILFLGFRKDVPQILSACDALVAPTRYEAYGLGVHEALCCGLPAVVSASAGVAERYPESLKKLLILDPENADAIADLLVDLRKNIVSTTREVKLLSAELRRRTWDDMARDIEQLCDARA